MHQSESQPETQSGLIVRLKDHRNERSWSEFVGAYEPFLRQLVRRQGTPERHVPDVTQQLLLAIAHSVDTWRDDGHAASFRRWLYRVARHVVIRAMRRERRQVSALGGTDFLERLEQTPAPLDDQPERDYEFELVVWAAAQVRHEFQERSWRAFWGTQVEGRTVAAMAEELEVTPGSIYMSRSRILARIRGKIAEVTDE